jgi:thiamine-monophosphate kinase
MSGEETRIRSEAELIETYLAPLAAGDPEGVGLGDDCAFLAPPAGALLVLKTDPLAEGVHFLADEAPEDIAWKALAVNVSDLAAKAATPLGYLLALSFPEPPTHGFMRRFAAGLADAQRAFGMRLLGGDTDRRPGPMTVTPTVLGAGPAGARLIRRNARHGDVLFVSGTLGDGALGLALRRDPALATPAGLTEQGAAHLRARYRRPEPRLALARALMAHGRAAMDLSDGLVKDLGRLCRASGTGAIVEAARLPVSAPAQAMLRADPSRLSLVLAGGDDYEVLAAVPPERAAAFAADAAKDGAPVTEIGRLGADPGVQIIGPDGAELDPGTSGYDHFS